MKKAVTHNKPSLFIKVRNAFFAGLIILLPVIVTVSVLVFLFKMIDGVLGGIIYSLIGKQIWGLGFLVTIALIVGIGFLTKNIVGKSLLKYFEDVFERVPLVKNIYTSSKQIVNAITMSSSKSSFKQVVLVEYPRREMYTVGFVTREEETAIKTEGESLRKELISIFLPTSPNPTSGYFVMVPRTDVQVLDMSVEEGIKLIMSAGIVTPGEDEPRQLPAAR